MGRVARADRHAEGGESRDSAIARMGRVLTRLAAGTGGPLLVVSHGGVMRLWLMGVMAASVPMIGNGHTFEIVHDAAGVRARRLE